ncbi:lipid phosphate phosphatase 1 [Lactarius deliciosus]|nr:lipid phosphate phosphatase 1 [Lactarius deliciosus]
MADFLRRVKHKINELYGDSFPWFDSSYVVDWVVVTGLFMLSWLIDTLPVFERDFSPNDPLIQHPHTSQRIPSDTNNFVTLMVPVALSVFIGGYRGSVHEIHHGLLAACAGKALSLLTTEALKNRVGRLRPDFLARCQWDASQHICTGKFDDIIDGRKSFPSGHSSTAFVGMTFTALFLAGKTAALCFDVSPFPGTFLNSRLARLALDYRHHKEDVIVGSVIGILSGTICYLLYWPNPFSATSFSADTIGCPRLATHIVSHRSTDDDYRLVPGGADFGTV